MCKRFLLSFIVLYFYSFLLALLSGPIAKMHLFSPVDGGEWCREREGICVCDLVKR